MTVVNPESFAPTNPQNSSTEQTPLRSSGIYNMNEWLNLELSMDEKEMIIGTPENAIIRPKTKNLIEAPEKSFKTSFLLRLLAGLSCGETVFPELHVVRPRKVLYLHGELSDAEIKERTVSVARSLEAVEVTNFWQGRVGSVHLIEGAGQNALKRLLDTYEPDDVALDPWQCFITGHEENSYKEVSFATSFCSDLIEEYGVTLWIPIHQGKNPDRGARGHSIIAGWRDTRIELKRNGARLSVTVEPRWGTPLKPFALRLTEGTLWSDDAMEFRGQTASIRDFVTRNNGKVSREALRGHLQLEREPFRKALERAEKQGAIVKGIDFVSLPLDPSASNLPQTQ
jgi:hypothetical protein